MNINMMSGIVDCKHNDPLHLWKSSSCEADDQTILRLGSLPPVIALDEKLHTALLQVCEVSGSERLKLMHKVVDLICRRVEVFRKLNQGKRVKDAIIDLRNDEALAEKILTTPMDTLVLFKHAQYSVQWSAKKWAEVLEKNPGIFRSLDLRIQCHQVCVRAAVQADCMNYEHLPRALREKSTVARWALEAKGCGLSEFESLHRFLPDTLKYDMKTVFEWHKKGWLGPGRSEKLLGPLQARLKMIATLKKMGSVWEALRFLEAKWESSDISKAISEHQKNEPSPQRVPSDKKSMRL